MGWSVGASVATEKLWSLGGWVSSKFWNFHPAIRRHGEVWQADNGMLGTVSSGQRPPVLGELDREGWSRRVGSKPGEGRRGTQANRVNVAVAEGEKHQTQPRQQQPGNREVERGTAAATTSAAWAKLARRASRIY